LLKSWLKRHFAAEESTEYVIADLHTQWLLSVMAGLLKKPAPTRNPAPRGTPLSQLIREAKELHFSLESVKASHVFDEGESAPSSRYIVFTKVAGLPEAAQPQSCESVPAGRSSTAFAGAAQPKPDANARAADNTVPAVCADIVPAKAQPCTDAALVAPMRVFINPFLILGQRDGKCLVAEPNGKPPLALPIAATKAVLEDTLIFKMVALEKLPQDHPENFGWKWFARAFFKRKAVIRDVLLGSLFTQLIALGYPLATQAIVDKVIQNQAVSTLIALGIGIAMLALFSAGITWLRQKFLLRLANLVDAELAAEMVLHLLRLPIRYFESRATGVIINRLHGVERVREFFAGTFTLVALELPFSSVFLILMLTYSWQLSLLSLGFLTVMLTASFAVGPKLREHINRQSLLAAKVQGYLTEHVAATETIKSLQMENEVAGRYQELNTAYLVSARATKELANGYSTFMSCTEQLMNAAVICTGAYLAMTTTTLTIGMLVAFQMFAQRVTQPLLRLSGAWQELQQVRVSVAMLGDMMNAIPERYSSIASSSGSDEGRLEVTGLGFRYAQDRPYLYKDFSFSVKPGSMTLITGPSGSGKSTLAKILLGLYLDYEGLVKVDGRDTRSMSANEVRRFFGVVPQETVLFSGTILENLLSGAPGAGLALAEEACKLAGIHEAIVNMPQGYLTALGERGVGLSGGQRQRVGIARALLKRPKVLIFDESTSGLDELAAHKIAETVNLMRGKVTVLFIAHRIPGPLVHDAHIELGSSAKPLP